jgi:CubicO group peptidase (beta-lactamase class C family)
MSSVTSSGHCLPKFEKIKHEFERRLASGEDGGGSLAIIQNGELVVDLWGGVAHPEKNIPWTENTLTNTWSITKQMSALSALILIDRGELDLDMPVAHYWPAFAQNGKQDVTVRHLLSHAAGLSGWEQPIDMIDICDMDRSITALAAQAPFWKPGEGSGYHMLSYGHLVSGLIKSVTGQSLSQFFRAEVSSVLDADFHIGLPITEHHRAAETYGLGGPPSLPPEGSIAFKTFTGPLPMPHVTNTIVWRTAGNGAAGGFGNARSIATIQQVMSHKGLAGAKQLLSEKTIAEALTPQQRGIDHVIGHEICWGLGCELGEAGLYPWLPKRKIAMGAGAGGSLVINDLEHTSTFAYTMNRMEPGSMVGNPNSIAYYQLFDAIQTENA